MHQPEEELDDVVSLASFGEAMRKQAERKKEGKV